MADFFDDFIETDPDSETGGFLDDLGRRFRGAFDRMSGGVAPVVNGVSEIEAHLVGLEDRVGRMEFFEKLGPQLVADANRITNSLNEWRGAQERQISVNRAYNLNMQHTRQSMSLLQGDASTLTQRMKTLREVMGVSLRGMDMRVLADQEFDKHAKEIDQYTTAIKKHTNELGELQKERNKLASEIEPISRVGGGVPVDYTAQILELEQLSKTWDDLDTKRRTVTAAIEKRKDTKNLGKITSKVEKDETGKDRTVLVYDETAKQYNAELKERRGYMDEMEKIASRREELQRNLSEIQAIEVSGVDPSDLRRYEQDIKVLEEYDKKIREISAKRQEAQNQIAGRYKSEGEFLESFDPDKIADVAQAEQVRKVNEFKDAEKEVRSMQRTVRENAKAIEQILDGVEKRIESGIDEMRAYANAEEEIAEASDRLAESQKGLHRRLEQMVEKGSGVVQPEDRGYYEEVSGKALGVSRTISSRHVADTPSGEEEIIGRSDDPGLVRKAGRDVESTAYKIVGDIASGRDRLLSMRNMLEEAGANTNILESIQDGLVRSGKAMDFLARKGHELQQLSLSDDPSFERMNQVLSELVRGTNRYLEVAGSVDDTLEWTGEAAQFSEKELKKYNEQLKEYRRLAVEVGAGGAQFLKAGHGGTQVPGSDVVDRIRNQVGDLVQGSMTGEDRGAVDNILGIDKVVHRMQHLLKQADISPESSTEITDILSKIDRHFDEGRFAQGSIGVESAFNELNQELDSVSPNINRVHKILGKMISEVESYGRRVKSVIMPLQQGVPLVESAQGGQGEVERMFNAMLADEAEVKRLGGLLRKVRDDLPRGASGTEIGAAAEGYVEKTQDIGEERDERLGRMGDRASVLGTRMQDVENRMGAFISGVGEGKTELLQHANALEGLDDALSSVDGDLERVKDELVEYANALYKSGNLTEAQQRVVIEYRDDIVQAREAVGGFLDVLDTRRLEGWTGSVRDMIVPLDGLIRRLDELGLTGGTSPLLSSKGIQTTVGNIHQEEPAPGQKYIGSTGKHIEKYGSTLEHTEDPKGDKGFANPFVFIGSRWNKAKWGDRKNRIAEYSKILGEEVKEDELTVKGEREEHVQMYGRMLDKQYREGVKTAEDFAKLYGEKLMCSCAPQLCHGHILAKWVDRSFHQLSQDAQQEILRSLAKNGKKVQKDFSPQELAQKARIDEQLDELLPGMVPQIPTLAEQDPEWKRQREKENRQIEKDVTDKLTGKTYSKEIAVPTAEGTGARRVEIDVPVAAEKINKAGESATSKAESVRRLHERVADQLGIALNEILEVSSAGSKEIGQKLSAFNLKLKIGGKEYSVESLYQGSKVFEDGQSLHDLYDADSGTAKKDPRHQGKKPVGFDFMGRKFKADDQHSFYNWLYLNALTQSMPDVGEQIKGYKAFTDLFSRKGSAMQSESMAMASTLAQKGLLTPEYVRDPKNLGATRVDAFPVKPVDEFTEGVFKQVYPGMENLSDDIKKILRETPLFQNALRDARESLEVMGRVKARPSQFRNIMEMLTGGGIKDKAFEVLRKAPENLKEGGGLRNALRKFEQLVMFARDRGVGITTVERELEERRGRDKIRVERESDIEDREATRPSRTTFGGKRAQDRVTITAEAARRMLFEEADRRESNEGDRLRQMIKEAGNNLEKLFRMLDKDLNELGNRVSSDTVEAGELADFTTSDEEKFRRRIDDAERKRLAASRQRVETEIDKADERGDFKRVTRLMKHRHKIRSMQNQLEDAASWSAYWERNLREKKLVAVAKKTREQAYDKRMAEVQKEVESSDVYKGVQDEFRLPPQLKAVKEYLIKTVNYVRGIAPDLGRFDLDVAGREDLLKKKGVAVIGNRYPAPGAKGKAEQTRAFGIAERLGERLAEEGINVVSGLAAGADTAAHKGALKAGGTTTMVPPTGLDDSVLGKQISSMLTSYLDKGRHVFVSMFDKMQGKTRDTAMARNDLVRELSDAIVAVGVAERSGGSYQMGLDAIKQGKPLYVISPDDLPGKQEGSRDLIQQGGQEVTLKALREKGVGIFTGKEAIQDEIEQLDLFGVRKSDEERERQRRQAYDYARRGGKQEGQETGQRGTADPESMKSGLWYMFRELKHWKEGFASFDKGALQEKLSRAGVDPNLVQNFYDTFSRGEATFARSLKGKDRASKAQLRDFPENVSDTWDDYIHAANNLFVRLEKVDKVSDLSGDELNALVRSLERLEESGESLIPDLERMDAVIGTKNSMGRSVPATTEKLKELDRVIARIGKESKSAKDFISNIHKMPDAMYRVSDMFRQAESEGKKSLQVGGFDISRFDDMGWENTTWGLGKFRMEQLAGSEGIRGAGLPAMRIRERNPVGLMRPIDMTLEDFGKNVREMTGQMFRRIELPPDEFGVTAPWQHERRDQFWGIVDRLGGEREGGTPYMKGMPWSWQDTGVKTEFWWTPQSWEGTGGKAFDVLHDKGFDPRLRTSPILGDVGHYNEGEVARITESRNPEVYPRGFVTFIDNQLRLVAGDFRDALRSEFGGAIREVADDFSRVGYGQLNSFIGRIDSGAQGGRKGFEAALVNAGEASQYEIFKQLRQVSSMPRIGGRPGHLAGEGLLTPNLVDELTRGLPLFDRVREIASVVGATAWHTKRSVSELVQEIMELGRSAGMAVPSLEDLDAILGTKRSLIPVTDQLRENMQALSGSVKTFGHDAERAGDIAEGEFEQPLDEIITRLGQLRTAVGDAVPEGVFNNASSQVDRLRNSIQTLMNAQDAMESLMESGEVDVDRLRESYRLLRSAMENVGVNLRSIGNVMEHVEGQTDEATKETDDYKRSVREITQVLGRYQTQLGGVEGQLKDVGEESRRVADAAGVVQRAAGVDVTDRGIDISWREEEDWRKLTSGQRQTIIDERQRVKWKDPGKAGVSGMSDSPIPDLDPLDLESLGGSQRVQELSSSIGQLKSQVGDPAFQAHLQTLKSELFQKGASRGEMYGVETAEREWNRLQNGMEGILRLYSKYERAVQKNPEGDHSKQLRKLQVALTDYQQGVVNVIGTLGTLDDVTRTGHRQTDRFEETIESARDELKLYEKQIDAVTHGLSLVTKVTRQGGALPKGGGIFRGGMQEGDAPITGVHDFRNISFVDLFASMEIFERIYFHLERLITVTSEFEFQMTRVGSIAGAVGARFDQLEAAARYWGERSIYSATETAEAMEELAKVGFNTVEVIRALPSVLNVAAAEGLQLAQAAELIAANLQAFEMRTHESGRLSNVLAAASIRTAASMQDFGVGLRTVATFAHTANVSVEETVALLGRLADAGLTPRRASVGLRALIQQLQRLERSGARRELDRMNLAMVDIDPKVVGLTTAISRLDEKIQDFGSDADKIFTVQASQAFQILAQAGAHSLRGLTNAITDTQDASDLAAAQMDTFYGSTRRLKSVFEEFMISLGTGMAPIINFFGSILSGLMKIVSALGSEFVAITGALTLFGAALAMSAQAYTIWLYSQSLMGAQVDEVKGKIANLIKLLRNPYVAAITVATAAAITLWKVIENQRKEAERAARAAREALRQEIRIRDQLLDKIAQQPRRQERTIFTKVQQEQIDKAAKRVDALALAFTETGKIIFETRAQLEDFIGTMRRADLEFPALKKLEEELKRVSEHWLSLEEKIAFHLFMQDIRDMDFKLKFELDDGTVVEKLVKITGFINELGEAMFKTSDGAAITGENLDRLNDAFRAYMRNDKLDLALQGADLLKNDVETAVESIRKLLKFEEKWISDDDRALMLEKRAATLLSGGYGTFVREGESKGELIKGYTSGRVALKEAREGIGSAFEELVEEYRGKLLEVGVSAIQRGADLDGALGVVVGQLDTALVAYFQRIADTMPGVRYDVTELQKHVSALTANVLNAARAELHIKRLHEGIEPEVEEAVGRTGIATYRGDIGRMRHLEKQIDQFYKFGNMLKPVSMRGVIEDVDSALDGDTIRVKLVDSGDMIEVRSAGVDTPESRLYKVPEPYAEAATEAAREYFKPGTEVEFGEYRGGSTFKRDVGTLRRVGDDMTFDERQLQAGLAELTGFPMDPALAERYWNAQLDAMKRGVGMWERTTDNQLLWSAQQKKIIAQLHEQTDISEKQTDQMVKDLKEDANRTRVAEGGKADVGPLSGYTLGPMWGMLEQAEQAIARIGPEVMATDLALRDNLSRTMSELNLYLEMIGKARAGLQDPRYTEDSEEKQKLKDDLEKLHADVIDGVTKVIGITQDMVKDYVKEQQDTLLEDLSDAGLRIQAVRVRAGLRDLYRYIEVPEDIVDARSVRLYKEIFEGTRDSLDKAVESASKKVDELGKGSAGEIAEYYVGLMDVVGGRIATTLTDDLLSVVDVVVGDVEQAMANWQVLHRDPTAVGNVHAKAADVIGQVYREYGNRLTVGLTELTDAQLFSQIESLHRAFVQVQSVSSDLLSDTDRATVIAGIHKTLESLIGQLLSSVPEDLSELDLGYGTALNRLKLADQIEAVLSMFMGHEEGYGDRQLRANMQGQMRQARKSVFSYLERVLVEDIKGYLDAGMDLDDVLPRFGLEFKELRKTDQGRKVVNSIMDQVGDYVSELESMTAEQRAERFKEIVKGTGEGLEEADNMLAGMARRFLRRRLGLFNMHIRNEATRLAAESGGERSVAEITVELEREFKDVRTAIQSALDSLKLSTYTDRLVTSIESGTQEWMYSLGRSFEEGFVNVEKTFAGVADNMEVYRHFLVEDGKISGEKILVEAGKLNMTYKEYIETFAPQLEALSQKLGAAKQQMSEESQKAYDNIDKFMKESGFGPIAESPEKRFFFDTPGDIGNWRFADERRRINSEKARLKREEALGSLALAETDEALPKGAKARHKFTFKEMQASLDLQLKNLEEFEGYQQSIRNSLRAFSQGLAQAAKRAKESNSDLAPVLEHASSVFEDFYQVEARLNLSQHLYGLGDAGEKASRGMLTFLEQMDGSAAVMNLFTSRFKIENENVMAGLQLFSGALTALATGQGWGGAAAGGVGGVIGGIIGSAVPAIGTAAGAYVGQSLGTGLYDAFSQRDQMEDEASEALGGDRDGLAASRVNVRNTTIHIGSIVNENNFDVNEQVDYRKFSEELALQTEADIREIVV